MLDLTAKVFKNLYFASLIAVILFTTGIWLVIDGFNDIEKENIDQIIRNNRLLGYEEGRYEMFYEIMSYPGGYDDYMKYTRRSMTSEELNDLHNYGTRWLDRTRLEHMLSDTEYKQLERHVDRVQQDLLRAHIRGSIEDKDID